ncbi:mycofactocin system GMC family oxidoreductase MftG [Gordonia zhaorongruii]|uniref:mycofactocin system GMC family oxidoreductase MftG n=1 Tax=Gordonia zhaorongruii TaxID=2597659 RepID=UPI0010516DA5|nr:mycofactocin system GMC family oxidoreductase MftG [Gordonia zhaorongruii]
MTDGLRPDVLIVGAGSAGCVLAERLTRDDSRTVLLIDRGPSGPFETELTRLPIEASSRAVVVPERRGRPVVRGSGFGGSSAINGGYFLRGHRTDYRGWPWPQQEIDAAFDEVDGGSAGSGSMHVSAFGDDELGDVARAVETWHGSSLVAGPYPGPGLVRVRGNRERGRRWTTAHLLTAAGDRPNLRRLSSVQAESLVVSGGRVTGVVASSGERIDAGEVVLCAGTLGTARLVAPLLGDLPVHEHPERMVRFTPRRPPTAPALLQTVVHTAEGLEVRPYGADFAAFTADPISNDGAVPIGVADMMGTTGLLGADGTVDLGAPDEDSAARLATGVEMVVDMLASHAFADLVAPGSVRVDPVIGMSQHAWGSLPAGHAVDTTGSVDGVPGLRVVDASILPGPLHSGPHETVVMLATLIGERM